MRDLTTADLDWVDESITSFDTASLVDRHSAFDGNFRSQRDLRVDGELKGNVACDGTLFVSEGATIAATVEAEHITVAGELTGEIRCRGRFQILPSGRVRANVSTGSLVIQEGAIYEGQLDMAGIERSSLRPIRARSSIASVGQVTQDSLSDSRGTALRTFGGWEVPKRPGDPQKGTLTITQQMTNPMLTGRSASSGRQARRREVYNLPPVLVALNSWRRRGRGTLRPTSGQ